ncbi:MAG: hypothetical protein EBQ60_08080 [Actinobacteria bacterium]|jgi:hypothetical protein|nr:hypothetical protein [Actinomycetota bacterium]
MSKQTAGQQTNILTKVGAGLFLLWSILHIYVGVNGIINFVTKNLSEQWKLLIGGNKVPFSDFIVPQDATTAYGQSHLILNFCIDVGGYGVLGIFVAWMIWKKSSWTGYFIGLVAIGICDLTFLFALVTSGVIEKNLATLAGPIIWFMAVAVTPFGLRQSLNK